MKTCVLLLALLLALARVWIGMNIAPPAHISGVDVFKDAAHVFMGGLFVGWYIQRKPWQWRLFWAMNWLEVAAAILSRQ